MYFYVVLAVFINFFDNGFCDSLISWYMNDLCGAEISMYNLAGEVYFDTEAFKNNDFKNVCKLTVTPATLNQNGDNMVMFYFTTFELQSDCNTINVTVRDGRYSTDNIVQGLPRYLCGVNSTLTEQVFSTTGESFHIYVSMNEHLSHYRGHFHLKFLTYHTGSCDETNVYRCSNGRCIPLIYNCSENIKACTEADDECTDDENTETIGDWFGNIIRYLFIFVAFICIICLLKVMMKQGRRKCNEDSVRNCFPDVRSKCSNCCKLVNLSRCPKPRLLHFVISRLRRNSHETSDESTEDRSTPEAVVNSAYSGSFDQIDQISIQTPSMTVLPHSVTSPSDLPSYEEAMASSTHSFPSLQTEDPAPAYEEEFISPDYMSLPSRATEYSTTGNETGINNDIDLGPSDADDTNNETNERITNSNLIIQSSLNTDTSSVLNYYLSDFAVELSDDYSTDPDWDSQSNSSVLTQEQTTETQSVPSANDESNAEIPVPPPPSYDDAVPPPYYYDYIANVGRYRQDFVTRSDT